MKPRAFALALVPLLLAGCASTGTHRIQAARQEVDRIAAECRAKRLAGELPSYVASAHCSNDRMRRAIAEGGYPYMDLVDLWLAYRLALSQRVDEGILSEADAQLLHAEIITRLNSEAFQRSAVAAQTEAQRTQAYGALLQGLGVWQESLRPAPPAPRMWRQPITCYSLGYVIQCYYYGEQKCLTPQVA